MFTAKRDHSLIIISESGLKDRIKENYENIEYLKAIADTLPDNSKMKRIIEVNVFTNRMLKSMLECEKIVKG